jgi:hypothetical protein
LALVVLGSGIIFISASAFGSKRFAGILLSGKQPAPPAVTLHAAVEFGSLMNISRPFASNVCEKSPARSSAVGMRYSRTGPGRWTCGASNE